MNKLIGTIVSEVRNAMNKAVYNTIEPISENDAGQDRNPSKSTGGGGQRKGRGGGRGQSSGKSGGGKGGCR